MICRASIELLLCDEQEQDFRDGFVFGKSMVIKKDLYDQDCGGSSGSD